MTSYQESYEKMSVSSALLLLSNVAITSTLQGFAGYFSIIQTTNTQIQATVALQEADKSGDTVAKSMIRATLVTEGIDIGRKVVAYATNTNNSALLALVNYTESDLKSASDQKLIGICQVIHDNANANVGALAPYFVTAATISTLQATILVLRIR